MMKITGFSHLFKWENLHNWWLTKYFFAPLYRIWLCLRVQTDRCLTVPCVFERLSRYFESKQYRNPGQDPSGKNGTYGCNQGVICEKNREGDAFEFFY